MLNLEEINKEIEKLENGTTSYSTCDKLYRLYTVRDHLMERDKSRMQKKAHDRAALELGRATGNAPSSFTREMANEWILHMENADGTTGPHWSIEQTQQIQAQRGIGCPPLAFYVTVNMMYSDYEDVAKKLGVNLVDFCAYLAKAFLHDKDAVGGGGAEKLTAYYEYVVKH